MQTFLFSLIGWQKDQPMEYEDQTTNTPDFSNIWNEKIKYGDYRSQ